MFTLMCAKFSDNIQIFDQIYQLNFYMRTILINDKTALAEEFKSCKLSLPSVKFWINL